MSRAVGCGWANSFYAVLASCGVLSWADWKSTGRCVSPTAYRSYVTARLASSELDVWKVDVGRHTAQVPYNLFQPVPSSEYACVLQSDLAWQHHLKIRAWSQVRAGLLVLRHLGGRRTQARFQCCVFCGMPGIRNGTKHVLSKCQVWSEFHRAIRETMLWGDLTDDQLVLQVLGCGCTDRCFVCVLDLAHMFCQRHGSVVTASARIPDRERAGDCPQPVVARQIDARTTGGGGSSAVTRSVCRR